jgi:hypothetical protein
VTPWDTDLLALVRNPATPPGVIRDKLLDGGLDVQSVWVVYGEAGDGYRAEWAVAAFVDKDRADALCEACNGWAMEHGLHEDSEVPRPDYRVRHELRNPHDLCKMATWVEILYYVVEVPLRWE